MDAPEPGGLRTAGGGSIEIGVQGRGYVLCGSDTTEPVLSEAVCRDGGLPAITLFIAAAFAPFLVVAVGGPIALRRRNARLFVMSVLAPPVVLAALYFVVGALNGW